MLYHLFLSEVAICLLLTSGTLAQTGQGAASPSDKVRGTVVETKEVSSAGFDRPAILIPADSSQVTTRILLRLDSTPAEGDLEAGLLVSTQRPDFLVRPHVNMIGDPLQVRAGEFLTILQVDGLVVFGESTVPLLYKGKQVETLRFSKPGLVARPPTGDSFVVYENRPSSLMLILENPSAFAYTSVRARLRFVGEDVCLFTAEKFGKTFNSSATTPSCDDHKDWTEFEIPQFAQVSLRGTPSASWFFDADSHLARSAKRKGWLTLRFERKGEDKDVVAHQILEQNLPIEFQFEPAGRSLFLSLLYVAGFLLLGALLSLLLRVSIPNIRRRSQLKDQLNDLGKVILTISTEVDSTLRVLPRVERRALDELRTAVWSFGPGYAEYATRVEQELPRLKRRIDAVVQLDAALIRRKTLYDQGVAPTRLEQIEEMLSAASETLKQDQLAEEDWVFVKQRLEGAQKLLREPTQTEKEAFEAMLSGRWKFIRAHFGDANGVLKVPNELKGMEACFPSPSLLPAANDNDGMEWLNAVGVLRADLQLSALALVAEFQFLAPSASTPDDQKWIDAKATLNRLLSTPAIETLRDAKRLLRQLAEGVSEADIIKALQNDGAAIVMDPTVARPDRTIRFSVRFRKQNLNSAAAREIVACHWMFTDSYAPRLSRPRLPFFKNNEKPAGETESIRLPEEGWSVHHYFEKFVRTSCVSLSFYDSKGAPINLGTNPQWATLQVKPEPDRRGREKWQRFSVELTQLAGALLVPLAALASTTVSGGTGGTHLWELVAIGFGSDTIKNILVGKNESQTVTQATGK